LGFVNYVRRFIPNMAGLTKALIDLLHKGADYQWEEKQQVAFGGLKNGLILPPVLRIADPERPFEVMTDASDIAIGAILLHDFGDGLPPIVYKSQKLQSAERNYPCTRQRNAGDRATRSNHLAMLPNRSRRDCMNRSQIPTVPASAAGIPTRGRLGTPSPRGGGRGGKRGGRGGGGSGGGGGGGGDGDADEGTRAGAPAQH
ncbi:hypothetical protein CLOP_g10468, partial [Closterium sp. NIES-67]